MVGWGGWEAQHPVLGDSGTKASLLDLSPPRVCQAKHAHGRMLLPDAFPGRIPTRSHLRGHHLPFRWRGCGGGVSMQRVWLGTRLEKWEERMSPTL